MKQQIVVRENLFRHPTQDERRWLGLMEEWTRDKSPSVHECLSRLFVHMVRDEGMNTIAAERAIEDLKRYHGSTLWLLFTGRERVPSRPLVVQPAPTFWGRVRNGFASTIRRCA